MLKEAVPSHWRGVDERGGGAAEEDDPAGADDIAGREAGADLPAMFIRAHDLLRRTAGQGLGRLTLEPPFGCLPNKLWPR